MQYKHLYAGWKRFTISVAQNWHSVFLTSFLTIDCHEFPTLEFKRFAIIPFFKFLYFC